MKDSPTARLFEHQHSDGRQVARSRHVPFRDLRYAVGLSGSAALGEVGAAYCADVGQSAGAVFAARAAECAALQTVCRRIWGNTASGCITPPIQILTKTNLDGWGLHS